jgi:Family of unknown function (DUF6221)
VGITEFIAARLDEDEAAANAGARRVGMPWRAEPQPGTPGGLVTDDLGLVGTTGGLYAAEHIARHDPARVLREVAAKRVVMDWWQRSDPEPGRAPSPTYENWRKSLPGYRLVLAVAAVYSGHPDYRAEWKP